MMFKLLNCVWKDAESCCKCSASTFNVPSVYGQLYLNISPSAAARSSGLCFINELVQDDCLIMHVYDRPSAIRAKLTTSAGEERPVTPPTLNEWRFLRNARVLDSHARGL